MIAMKELLGGRTIADIEHSAQLNLDELLKRINVIREAWGKPMTVTSGFRDPQDQLRIYRAKGIPDNKIPMGSAHLKGAAVDILDTDGSLMQWCRDNVPLLEKTELWCEDDPSTPRVHFQIYPPGSGNRFFKP
jgi:hypothetical protein